MNPIDSEPSTGGRLRTRTKILISIPVAICFLVGALYFWLSPLDREVDIGLQKLQEPPLILAGEGVPADWQWFAHDNWTMAYPAQFQVHKPPQTTSGQNSFLFTSNDKTVSIDVTVKSFASLLEKDLIQKLQRIASYKHYRADTLDAILLLEQVESDSRPENERPAIMVERKIISNEIPGVQFASADQQRLMFFRTSFENNGKIIDITTHPKSFDESDRSMRIYLGMISSFHYSH